MSYNVAKIFGLSGKGRIAVGMDADIVLINLDQEKVVDPEELHYWHADFTLYDGWTIKGWPVTTILNGRPVVINGETVTSAGIGKYLPRELENPKEIPTVLI
jgi:dihydroorotase-like cyclic amidohydrolase